MARRHKWRVANNKMMAKRTVDKKRQKAIRMIQRWWRLRKWRKLVRDMMYLYIKVNKNPKIKEKVKRL
jgi:hypothetical protein